MSDFFDFLPENWGSTERELYKDAFADSDAFDDRTAQTLFNEAYFNFDLSTDDKNAIRDALDQYLDQMYDFDFDSQFDWEAYRDAYEGEG